MVSLKKALHMSTMGKGIGATGGKFRHFVVGEGLLLLDYLHPIILHPHEGVVGAPEGMGMETPGRRACSHLPHSPATIV